MSAYDTITTGLSGSGLVLACFVAIYGTSDFHTNAQQMEDTLLDRSVAALEDVGLNWARVRIDGQHAYISGVAPSNAAQAAAVEVVKQSSGPGGFWRGGITRIETDFAETAQTSETDPYIWRATKTIEGDIVFIGAVPSESIRNALKGQAAQSTDIIIQDRLDIRVNAPAENWAEIASYGLANLQLLDQGEVRLSDLEVRLSGVAMRDTARIQAAAAIANVQDPWRGVSNITGPSHWHAAHVDSRLVLSGACENVDQCSEIVAIAEQYFDGEVINQMQVAASDLDPWIEGVRAGLPHFTQFDSGAMRFAPEAEGFAFDGKAAQSTLQFLRQDMAEITGPYAVSIVASNRQVELTELANVELDDNPLIACQRSFDLVMAANTVLFETGRANISRLSGSTLDKIMAVSQLCADNLRFEVIGHTDNTGNREANLRLSTDRAQAVANYMGLAGFDTARLIVSGRGPDQAVADNASEEGRAANRRIEFSIQQWSE